MRARSFAAALAFGGQGRQQVDAMSVLFGGIPLSHHADIGAHDVAVALSCCGVRRASGTESVLSGATVTLRVVWQL